MVEYTTQLSASQLGDAWLARSSGGGSASQTRCAAPVHPLREMTAQTARQTSQPLPQGPLSRHLSPSPPQLTTLVPSPP